MEGEVNVGDKVYFSEVRVFILKRTEPKSEFVNWFFKNSENRRVETGTYTISQKATYGMCDGVNEKLYKFKEDENQCWYIRQALSNLENVVLEGNNEIIKKSPNKIKVLDKIIPKLKYPLIKFRTIGRDGLLIAAGFKISDDKALTLDNKKLKIVDILIKLGNDQLFCIQQLAKFKLTNYEKSVELFGYGNIKKQMFESNKLFDIHNIIMDYKAKKDGLLHDVIELKTEDKNLKFSLSDGEFIFPNLNGYNVPKDKTVTFNNKSKYLNKQVKIINDRNINASKNQKAVVVEMWNDHIPIRGSHSSREEVGYDRNTKVKLLIEDKQITCKIKNIKLIE